MLLCAIGILPLASCGEKPAGLVIDNGSIGYRVFYYVNDEPLGFGRWLSSATISPHYLWKEANSVRFVAEFDMVDSMGGKGRINVSLLASATENKLLHKMETQYQTTPNEEWVWTFEQKGSRADPFEEFDVIGKLSDADQNSIDRILERFRTDFATSPVDGVSRFRSKDHAKCFPFVVLERLDALQRDGQEIRIDVTSKYRLLQGKRLVLVVPVVENGVERPLVAVSSPDASLEFGIIHLAVARGANGWQIVLPPDEP